MHMAISSSPFKARIVNITTRPASNWATMQLSRMSLRLAVYHLMLQNSGFLKAELVHAAKVSSTVAAV